MIDIIANLFVNVHSYKAKPSLFVDSNYFIFASTVSEYSLRQRLHRVLADHSTCLLHNALNNLCSTRFDVVFPGM